MGLAPGVLMRTIVLNFAIIGRARIHRCVQVGGINEDPVRSAGVSVAGMVLWPRIYGEGTGKGIDPCARA